jgi:lipopolysaccharide biosynthesis glycosyltransferase
MDDFLPHHDESWTDPVIPGRRKPVTFGIFSYRHSTNVGDYGQTLAQLNILSRFYRKDWTLPSPAVRQVLEWFSTTKPSGAGVRQRNYNSSVTVIWVDRDHNNNNSYVGEKPVYVIANGWYMHKVKGVFQWPFSDWIHPIFVSVHIANAEILNLPNSIEYLRTFGPVGARDRATETLLLSRGIPAYFSGCLTSTLESPEIGRVRTSTVFQNDLITPLPSAVHFSHTMSRLKNESCDVILARTFSIYRDYARCSAIQSTRIHTLLPAQALETPNLWFTTSSGGAPTPQEGRFSGLIDETMVHPSLRNMKALALTERLTEIFDRVLVNHFDSSDVLSLWRGRHVASMHPYSDQETLDLSSCENLPYSWDAFRKLHKGTVRCPVGGAVDRALDHNTQFYFHRENEHETNNNTVITYVFRNVPCFRFKNTMNIVITFDEVFLPIVAVFLFHLAQNNSDALLRVFCFTRGISPEEITEVVKNNAYLTNVILFDIPMPKGLFPKFQSFHERISISCMDRLCLPVVTFEVDDVVERVIYLDVDVMVNRSLIDMCFMDTGPKGILAVCSPFPHQLRKWLHQLQIKVKQFPTQTFNCGVFAADISKLKRNFFFGVCWKMCHDFNGSNDQVLANLYAEGSFAKLPARFNTFVTKTTTLDRKKTVNYHFIGAEKPWMFESAEKYPFDSEIWTVWSSKN